MRYLAKFFLWCVLGVFWGVQVGGMAGSGSVPTPPDQRLEYLYQQLEASKESAPELALKYGRQALELLKINPENRVKIRVLNGMCWAHSQLGQYREALDTGQEAELLATKLGAKQELAVAYGSLADVYLNLSDLQRALDYSLKAQSASEEAGYKKGLASALVSTARIERNLQEYDRALATYQRALTISQEMGDSSAGAWILNNIGTVYWNLKQFPKALDYYFRSLAFMKKTDCRVGQAFLLNNIACVYSDTGKYRPALQCDLEALQIYQELGNPTDIAYAYSYLGRDYRNLGDGKQGFFYMKKSLDMANSLQNEELKKILFEEYAHFYQKQGDYQQALVYYKKFKESGERILNQDKNQRIAHLQVVYDVEKKQKENQLLKNNNHIQKLELDRQRLQGKFLILVAILLLVLALVTYSRYLIRKRAARVLFLSEQKLKRMNDAKDKLFTIIAHDLGNPLNSILLSSGHLQRHSPLMEAGERDEFILDIYQQTQGLADLLENLLQWARVQTGRIARHLETVDMRLITEETLDMLQYTAQRKNIQVISRIQNTLVRADRHMMKSVMRNLVGNALKYTPQGGEVVISAVETGELIEVTVADNGVGIPPEKVGMLFNDEIHESTRGTANEKGTGLGLTLCREFVETHGGSIRVQSQLQQGSWFSFTLPKAMAS